MIDTSALAGVAKNLKKTTTLVTRRDGSKFVENSEGLHIEVPQSEEERASTLAALRPEALSLSLDDELTDASAQLHARRSTTSLRVVTWNIWFDALRQDERLQMLLCEAVREAPDAICLQEVVPRVAEAIRSCKPLCAVYAVSPYSISTYGVLMLVRKPLNPVFSQVPLPTGMGRSLLVAACADVVIATVHLESLDNAPTRRQQLERASAVLSATPLPAILCGDFNFDSSQNWGDWRKKKSGGKHTGLENAVLAAVVPDFVDAWPALRPRDPGLTFDGSCNPHVRDADERMRYDRVLARGMRPTDASVLGTTSPPVVEGGLLPSDHFGLRVDLQLA